MSKLSAQPIHSILWHSTVNTLLYCGWNWLLRVVMFCKLFRMKVTKVVILCLSQHPPVCQVLLIDQLYISHTSDHIWLNPPGWRAISSSHSPLPDNTHNRQTSISAVGFKPTIPADECPQTYALDRVATGTGKYLFYCLYCHFIHYRAKSHYHVSLTGSWDIQRLTFLRDNEMAF